MPDAIRDEIGSLRVYVRRRLGPRLRRRVDSEDVVQSTLAQAVRDLDAFESRGEGALGAWLRRIAERQLQLAARHHGAQRRALEREERLTRPDERAGKLETPSRIVERTERRSRVREAIAALPDERRHIVELHSLQGLSFAEVARRMGLRDRDAARYRFRVAITALRRALDERERPR